MAKIVRRSGLIDHSVDCVPGGNVLVGGGERHVGDGEPAGPDGGGGRPALQLPHELEA